MSCVPSLSCHCCSGETRTAPAVQMKSKRFNNILMHALSIEGWAFPPLAFPLMMINEGDVICLYSCKAFGEGREEEGDYFIRDWKEGSEQCWGLCWLLGSSRQELPSLAAFSAVSRVFIGVESPPGMKPQCP